MIETRGNVTLIGTAHILASSVREVEETIRAVRPKRVLVEIDPGRLKALQDPEAWQNTDIFRVLKEKKQHLFLLQLYLAAMQAQMGRETGVSPGSDMLRAVQVGGEVGAEVVLIDRDVAITLKRGFGAMGFWARLRLFWKVWMELLTPADPNAPPPDLEEVLKSDAITQMTEQFAKFAPAVKTALIDERDEFMASHILEEAANAGGGDVRIHGPWTATPAAGGIVAVVGAGHLKGIKKWLDRPDDIPARADLVKPPPRRFPVGLVIGFAIPLALAGWVSWEIYQGNTERVTEGIYWWIVLHFLFAGLGALLAFGHPLAVLTGAIAAPFTSILPVGIRSGWLSGLVQAKLRAPKVKDFQQIKHIDTFGQFWKNGVVRILTVTSLTILGSYVAKIVFFSFLASQVF